MSKRLYRGRQGTVTRKRVCRDPLKKLFLWRFDRHIGTWKMEREVNEETKDQWLLIFKKHAPEEEFVVASKKPTTHRDPSSKKCSNCGGGIYYGEHYAGCHKNFGAKHRPSEKGYGVFTFAEWVGGQDGHVFEQPSRGYVVRSMDHTGVPYSRMTPVRVFKRKGDAEKLADKMTFGEGQ